MKRFIKSAGNAIRGLRHALTHETNFRIHVAFALIAVGLAFLITISVSQWLALLGVISLVLVLELINTAIEKLLDGVHPRLHTTVGLIKDVMAGAVLVAALTAVLVGSLIFIPRLLER